MATMRKIRHVNVKEDGTFMDGQSGSVTTEGAIVMNSSLRFDSFWISIISPRTSEGIVEGLNITFDSEQEMKDFMKRGSLYGVKMT